MSTRKLRRPVLSDHAFPRFTILLPDAAIRMSGKLNALVYRASQGRIAGRFAHEPILALTTIGRRSGKRRSTTVLYRADGQRLVVVGSNTGRDRPPAWALNLADNPEAEVQIGGVRRPIRARIAQGEERETLWGLMSDLYSGFEEYRERTDRELLVFVLTPD